MWTCTDCFGPIDSRGVCACNDSHGRDVLRRIAEERERRAIQARIAEMDANEAARAALRQNRASSRAGHDKKGG